jgi:hypothetical protein
MAEGSKVIEESVRDPETGHYVHKCGEFVLQKTVFLTVRNDQMPWAGSGEVIRENTPYCPKCGPEPSMYGTILESETPTAQEVRILRQLGDDKP